MACPSSKFEIRKTCTTLVELKNHQLILLSRDVSNPNFQYRLSTKIEPKSANGDAAQSVEITISFQSMLASNKATNTSSGVLQAVTPPPCLGGNPWIKRSLSSISGVFLDTLSAFA